METAGDTVTARLPEVYQWLLAPEQAEPRSAVSWQAIRLTGTGPLAERAGRRLRSDELLIPTLGATILRKHLDEVPLWRGDHVEVRQLVEDFARYLYLPRLAGPDVLIDAIRDGVTLISWELDAFAFAESYDEAAERYRGLRVGKVPSVSPESAALLVKPEVACRQFDVEASPAATAPAPDRLEDPRPDGDEDASPEPPEKKARRFHGAVTLDTTRVGRDASRIADEVIAHLSGLVGSEVKVTLEIDAEIPEGAPDHVVRAVTENSRTLKFESHGFEES